MKREGIVRRYRRDIGAIRQRLLAGGEIVHTKSGPIEVGFAGEGPHVLSLHGGLGGYDQGLHAASAVVGNGYSVVAPSRFGYLRTPLPDDASAESMADALADLLDSLSIPSVTVIGTSSGGPSSIQFAIRHPEKVNALILNVAVIHAYEGISWLARLNNSIGWHSDFLFWYVIEKLGHKMARQYGISEEFVLSLPQVEQDYLIQVWRSCNPVSQRRLGMLNDLRHMENDYPIESIKAPTLIVHAVDDTINSFTHAEYAASRIPGSQLLTLESGGHLKLGHRERVRTEARRFLERVREVSTSGAEGNF